jgi:hypothetical protein
MSYPTPEPVVSGVTYQVTQVNGSAPHGAESFRGATTLTVTGETGSHLLSGQSLQSEDGTIRFFEKAGDPGGKDVRVWHIAPAGTEWVAVAGTPTGPVAGAATG